MTEQELKLAQETEINYLNDVLGAWRGPHRRLKKYLEAVLAFAAIAIYFVAFDLLGGFWGFVVAIAIISVALLCATELGISFKTEVIPDSKLAYRACITMEALIAIKQGNYAEYGVHTLTTGTGSHHELYKKFIQLYPEYKCRDLEKMSKIKIELKDI